MSASTETATPAGGFALKMPEQNENAEGTMYEGSDTPRSNAGVMKFLPQSGKDVVIVSQRVRVHLKCVVWVRRGLGWIRWVCDAPPTATHIAPRFRSPARMSSLSQSVLLHVTITRAGLG